MPGEERKFKRRRIIAFIPTCKRDRALDTSHTSIAVGIAAMGVVIDSLTSVAVESRRGVGVSEDTIVGGGVFVPVADDIKFAASVGVMNVKVACGDDIAEAVVVVECTVSVGESGANVADADCGIAD